MVDNMYPDNIPPEIAFPLMAAGLTFYFYSVIKERRAEVKARAELRKGTNN